MGGVFDGVECCGVGIAVLDFGVLGFALVARSEGVDAFEDTVGDSFPFDD